jgi:imidazolonepropionase-like amidohydrolase
VTVPGGHGDGSFAITGSTVEELAAQTELVCSHKPDLIKTCVTGGVLDAKKEGEPGELKMSVEQTKAVCDVAHAHGYKVASHTESTEGLKVALEAGVDTIEHGAVMTDEIVSLFKSKGAALICTISPALPLAQLDSSVTLLPPVAKVNAKVVADGVIEGAKSAVAAGIPVGLGTDASCPFVSQYNTWAELYWFQKYVGVTNAFAIYSGTLQNARILGIGDKTGSVEVGKWADLIVTDNNPLEDLKALRNVTMVMCAGQLVKEPKLKKNPAIEEQIDKLL